MRRRAFKILTGLAAVILILGLLYAIALAHSTIKLRRAYAALEADGRPMHRNEIIPPAVPDTENAALLYQSAIAMLKAQPTGRSLEGPPDESVQEMNVRQRHRDLLGYLSHRCSELTNDALGPDRIEELKALMSHRAVEYAFFAIEAGAQRPAFQPQRDYDAGPALQALELNDMRALARIIGGYARLEAAAGATDRAWQLAIIQAQLADALPNDPIMVSQLARMGMIGLSYRTIQYLVEIAPPGTEQQERLEMILRTFDDVTPLVRAIDGERLFYGEWVFTRPRNEWHKVVPGFDQDNALLKMIQSSLIRILSFKPVLLADHAEYVRIMHANAQRLEGPYSPETPFPKVAGRFMVSRMLVPTFSRVEVLHRQIVAQTRITRAGLALIRYRADHGEFPPTLDALDMDGLTDPFTGDPLLYRVEDDGFVVYSVGENLTDNGGTPWPERHHGDPRKPPEYDIVWRFPAERM